MPWRISPRPVNAGAVDVADALVAQADAQRRDVRPEAADDVVGYAGLHGGAGAGGDDYAVGGHFLDFVEGYLVVAVGVHLCAQLPQVLVEVVGEAVVVVY